MSIKSALKDVVTAFGGNPSSKNISGLLEELAIAKDPLMGLVIDADIDPETDLLGKTVDDLQENITIRNGVISGRSKYVTDYTDFSGDESEQSGHYLALHAEVPGVEGVTITFKGNITVTLDSDGILIYIVKNGSKKISFTASKDGYASVTREFTLNGVKFDPVVEE